MPFSIIIDKTPVRKEKARNKKASDKHLSGITCSLRCVYTYKQQKPFIFTAKQGEVTIRAKYGDFVKQEKHSQARVKKNSPAAFAINAAINEIYTKANQIITNIKYHDRQPPHVVLFRQKWQAKYMDSRVFEAWKAFMEGKKDVSPSAKSNYRGAMSRLKGYEKTYGNISFQSMKQTFLDNYIQYVLHLHNPRTGKTYSPNTVKLDISNIKHFLKWTLQRDMHTNNNFQIWELPDLTVYKDPESLYLTPFELQRIKRLDVSGAMQQAKDMFVFMTSTGLRHSEYQLLEKTRLNKRNSSLKYQQTKQRTYKENEIFVSPDVVRFFDSYQELPKIDLPTYNLLLKDIAKLAGIEKNLSSHKARYTFVTHARLAGISIEEVSRITGHADSKTTKIYEKDSQPGTAALGVYEFLKKQG